MNDRARHPVLIAALGLVLLAGVLAAGVSFGVSGLSVGHALQLLFFPDASPESALVWDVRLPRALLAMLVGANLAIAGVLIQTLTRNPLASPQTFGINAGASLAIVACLIAFPSLKGAGTVGPAFAGAAAVGLAMWALSISGVMNELKLALAGVSIQLVLSALVQAILIANNAAQDIVYWLAGSLSAAQWPKVSLILPFTLVGGGVALTGARHFSVLALDQTTGLSLGQNAKRTGGVAAILIVLLAGSAVAVCGPIGFIGLLVPHIVRRLAGGDIAVILVLSAIVGPLLLGAADLFGRIVVFPAEMPAGVVTALIGAPAFLLILYGKRTR
ncbi:iron ABC transporter permease [Ensifer adhaerens]|uniref:FecCD family ABC transporter permease n=1 Tax=Ensifer adhaerens TaxID=106592 RepID=UPI001CC14D60|nr:iron ABC transporter permease [Ensifer adhaerens]MBZ7924197.1 iron ABC transporter permease [Ensifer adhaerens]UAX96546.1 iron ABC transporter permease [Ensifer adhaerens]UAY04110.1 iron ABC transporter permease [Ensifer adhaerens]UAY12096.1 iron ABC transporter permease [Ensifer adhaerens]